MDLISVIIPTYKRTIDILSRAINSVLNQTYLELEIIIVDDSPQEFEGREKIFNYIQNIIDLRVKLIQHKTNLGANVARNTGILHSRGKYIAFLDDDDEWMPEKLFEQVKLFNKGNVGLVYCSVEKIILREDKVIKKSQFARYRGFIFERLMFGNVIGSTSSVIILRKCFDELGNFDTNMETAQDYELYLRIANKYEIDFVKGKALLRYYVHNGERISGNHIKAQRSRDYLELKYKQVLSNNSKHYSDFLLKRAIIASVGLDFFSARRYLIKGVQKKPLNVINIYIAIYDISKSYLKKYLQVVRANWRI